MSTNLEPQSDRVFRLRVQGQLKRSELDAVENDIVAKMTMCPVPERGEEEAQAWLAE